MIYLIHRRQKCLDTLGDSGAVFNQPYSVHSQNHFLRPTDCTFDSAVSPAKMKAGSAINTKPWPTNPRSLFGLCEQPLSAPASWAGGTQTRYRGSVARFPPLGITTLEKQHCSFVVTPKQKQSRTLRSEEHTSELQSRQYLVCRLLL